MERFDEVIDFAFDVTEALGQFLELVWGLLCGQDIVEFGLFHGDLRLAQTFKAMLGKATGMSRGRITHVYMCGVQVR